jgi:hypothetical protein
LSRVISRATNPFWDINRRHPLWRDCVLLLGGKGSGATALDSSGQNRHGTLVNGPTWGAGSGRRYITFNNALNQHITCGTISYAEGEPVALGAWVRTTQSSNYIGVIGGSTGGSNTIGLQVQSGTPRVYMFGAVSATTNVSDGKWHHILALRIGTTVYIYVDGVQENSATNSAYDSALGSHTLYVATLGNSNYDFLGDIADPCVWRRPLSVSEIRQLASLRPDLDGAIRSTVPMMTPVITGGAPPIETGFRSIFQVC